MLWKVRFSPSVLHIILCTTSSFLLALSFPNSSIELLAWIGLVPLFFVIDHTTLKGAFWFSYITGILFFSSTIYWLGHVTLSGLIMLVLYLAVYFGVFGGLVKFFWERSKYLLMPLYLRRLFDIFLPPILWVTLEFIRTHILTGFGWALLGYSQYLTLPAIQIADITGVYGVSFLIVFVNIGVYLLFRYLIMGIVRPFTIVILPWILLATSVIYGNSKLAEYPDNNRTLKVSIIQGNIPQNEKWNPELKIVILGKYELLTRLASMGEPDVIIWPETSFPEIIVLDEISRDVLYQRVATLARDVRIPILIGSQRNDALTGMGFNSAILISQDGNIERYYDKLHLVPFGEYVPLGRFFPFIGKAIDVGDFARGTEWTLFPLPQGKLPPSPRPTATRMDTPSASGGRIKVRGNSYVPRFGALICFEDTFPGQVRQFVRKGADFIVNITNDAWFGRTGAPYQHAQASVFRAIENRREVVRSANTGLSCFIDPDGRIKKLGLFITGYKTETITLAEEKSFYTTHGDLFAILCICISVIVVISSLSLRVPYFLIVNYSKSGIIKNQGGGRK